MGEFNCIKSTQGIREIKTTGLVQSRWLAILARAVQKGVDYGAKEAVIGHYFAVTLEVWRALVIGGINFLKKETTSACLRCWWWQGASREEALEGGKRVGTNHRFEVGGNVRRDEIWRAVKFMMHRRSPFFVHPGEYLSVEAVSLSQVAGLSSLSLVLGHHACSSVFPLLNSLAVLSHYSYHPNC